MKKIILIAVLLFGIIRAYCQDRFPPPPATKYSIFGGVNIINKEKAEYFFDRFISAEIGIDRRFVIPPIAAGYGFYFSNEFATNFNKFYIAPKIGANVTFYLFMIGSEFALYSDFQKKSLHIIPLFGFGIGGLKMNIRINIPLNNKDLFPVNFGFGVTLPVFTLKEIEKII